VLDEIQANMQAILDQNRSKNVLVKCDVIGHRPGGEIPQDHDLVQLACEALRAGEVTECTFGIASTDANVPLSRSMPAICVGLTRGGLAHTPREYIEIETIPNGYKMLDFLIRGALEVS
jgi:acetylornithine deacetylase/succinyl-diaminopimelate desuccinylase-like protein